MGNQVMWNSGIVTLIGWQYDSDILFTCSVGCLIGWGHVMWLTLCDVCAINNQFIKGTVYTKIVSTCNTAQVCNTVMWGLNQNIVSNWDWIQLLNNFPASFFFSFFFLAASGSIFMEHGMKKSMKWDEMGEEIIWQCFCVPEKLCIHLQNVCVPSQNNTQ